MSSIDSPPRYFSATLPPPKTKMHAASTQVMIFVIVLMMMFMIMFMMMFMVIFMMFMPPPKTNDSDAGQIL